MPTKNYHTVIPAVYCIFRDGDKILLLRRFNTGYMDGNYSLPAGHLEGDEPADTAACREAKEEVDVDIAAENLRLVHTLHRSTQESRRERIDLFFEVDAWLGNLKNAEPHKCDELKWANIHNLPNNMIPEVKAALECITKKVPYSNFNF